MLFLIFCELVNELTRESEFLFELAYSLAKEFLGWKDIGNFDAIVCSNAEGCLYAFEGKSYFRFVETSANQKSKCWIIFWCLHETIDSINVEIKFACKLWFELFCLELYNNIATEADMVEKEIDASGDS